MTVRTDEARTRRDADAWRQRHARADFRDELRHATNARTVFLFGSRDAFALTAVNFAHAAGWGPRQKRVAEGRSAMMTGIWLGHGARGGHPDEIVISFKPYPPYAHFKRPGVKRPGVNRSGVNRPDVKTPAR